MLTAAQRRSAADALASAERDRVPVARLTETLPGIEVADAYEIQRLQIADKLAVGRVVRGHKAGLTSPAMQQMMGVDEPDYGHLLDDMFVLEGGSVAVADLCQPRVEFEVAFVLGEALPEACTAEDVVRATELVFPAIEIIDSRFDGWNITLCDTIADNASSARVVLGPRGVAPAELDLRLIDVVVTKNGEHLDSGSSGAVLGNPAAAVAWLANKLHGFGERLEAGHIVMPGSCTRAHDVAPGDSIVAEFSKLGAVGVRFH
ncbi:MAG: 2-oxopent-4-enoate hydratase [Actinomycetia bacterium]|nr:2-oxopent-4-enoate hydratase [Actinomycetes bacterium]